ncbi:TauD/TfdA family dioxygenase [Methylobacterium tarhaniae]|nr:TauD/TfdA family dioxygenase [Methylobacterium tarhaniae]
MEITTFTGSDRIPVLAWDRDRSIRDWLVEHRGEVEAVLAERGAAILKAVIATPDGLTEISSALQYGVAELSEESSPRSQVSGDIFTSTDYPAAYPIQMHNEYSYGSRWPLRIMFGCLQPAKTGGETPLADMREVFKRLDHGLVHKFVEKKIMYRRNYTPGMGVGWQAAFGTEDRECVESYCASVGIRPIWIGKDTLRTEQVGDAVLTHPRTGESVWFNHAFFFNVRSLEPLSLREFMLGEDEDDLSTNTYYGDGERIEPEVIEELRRVIGACTVVAPWGKGDVMLVDNMLMAHGRTPFSGTRRVVVKMAEVVTRDATTAAAAAKPGS